MLLATSMTSASAATSAPVNGRWPARHLSARGRARRQLHLRALRTGLSCDHKTSASLCKSAGGLGQVCECEDTLWCDSLAVEPACKAPQTSGACSAYAFGQCAAGYVCIGVGEVGTCELLVGGDGNCAASPQLCGLGYECVNSFCVPVPPVNAPCDPLLNPYCSGATATHTSSRRPPRAPRSRQRAPPARGTSSADRGPVPGGSALPRTALPLSPAEEAGQDDLLLAGPPALPWRRPPTP